MDARIRYTRMVIRNTFLTLLQKKNIDKITVKEICDLSEINRATFYKYYDNAYDLLNKIEEEELDYLTERIALLNNAKIKDVFSIVLNDIIEKKDLYSVLFSENGDELFKQRLFALCYQDNIKLVEKHFSGLSKQKQEWIYYFIAEGCNGILSRWIRSGMKEEPCEIIDFLVSIIENINIHVVIAG